MVQEFVQRVKDTVGEALLDVHTALPGKIVSVDTSTGLATVLPTMKRTMANGTTLSYPQISGVPIVFPQGNGQYEAITYPVKAGDSCLLIISEESLEYWLYGRETDTTLLFDLSNAICIPGLFQNAPSTFAESCKNNSIILRAGNDRVAVSSSGISITGDVTISGSVTVRGNMSVTGDFTAPGVR